MMKVLIADDHLVVRKGLKGIVETMDEVSIVDEAKDGHEALARIEEGGYDIVILDITMPGPTGLDILRMMKYKNQKARILILSVHPQEQYAIRALRLGASGYLSKSSAYEELALAIKKISAGGKYVSSDLAEQYIFHKKGDPDKALHERLSDREFQIMCMIAQGKSVLEIARELLLSDKTVSTHRTHILEKMGMKKNADLMLYAIRNSLIE